MTNTKHKILPIRADNDYIEAIQELETHYMLNRSDVIRLAVNLLKINPIDVRTAHVIKTLHLNQVTAELFDSIDKPTNKG